MRMHLASFQAKSDIKSQIVSAICLILNNKNEKRFQEQIYCLPPDIVCMAISDHPNGEFVSPKTEKEFRVEAYPSFIPFIDRKKLTSHPYERKEEERVSQWEKKRKKKERGRRKRTTPAELGAAVAVEDQNRERKTLRGREREPLPLLRLVATTAPCRRRWRAFTEEPDTRRTDHEERGSARRRALSLLPKLPEQSLMPVEVVVKLRATVRTVPCQCY
ncbi:hypothetical protein AHAS_Ahas12G0084300 [Arachis hypogaea]